MSPAEIRIDVPCPTWCHQGHGHSYEPDGRGVSRGHTGLLGMSDELGIEVGIFALELCDPSGTVTVRTPTLSVHVTSDDERTPADLRRMAAVLLNAADVADVELG